VCKLFAMLAADYFILLAKFGQS